MDDETLDFSGAVLFCFQDKELVAEFDRLTGSNLSLRGSGLDVTIDFSSGRMGQDLEKFVDFVKECVWDRIPLSVWTGSLE